MSGYKRSYDAYRDRNRDRSRRWDDRRDGRWAHEDRGHPPRGPRGGGGHPDERRHRDEEIYRSRQEHHRDDAGENGRAPRVLDYSDRARSPHRRPTSAQPALRDPASARTIPAPVDDDEDSDSESKPKLTDEEILAAARAKRAAILAKHAAHVSREGTPAEGSGSVTKPLNSPAHHLMLKEAAADSSIPGTPAPASDAEAPLDLTQDVPSTASAVHPLDTGIVQGHQSISAADYNPDDDRRIDDRRQLEKEAAGQGVAVGPTAKAQVEPPANPPAPDTEEDDDDDMFAIGTKKAKKPRLDTSAAPLVPVIDRGEAASNAVADDNFDDSDGYYRFILGELLDSGRYHVHANLGKGMFASVVRARDTKSGDNHEVAIKVVRSQESMYKAGQKEASILRRLQEADPAAKYHVVRLERTFEHRGHLCLVFESLSMNLRDVVKRFGKDVGINLRAVRAYAHQILLALSLMKKCNIMHADLKPDNILVNEAKSVLKVCDLGSASDIIENEITPYLVSRFYRAPEIILGLPYDAGIDVWSIGCTLYELYTGKILFPGRSNNHLLLLIMELKGKFNAKMLKKARFAEVHFDEAGNFLSVEKNRATGADSVKAINIPPKPAQGLPARLMPLGVTRRMQPNDVAMLSAFVDLLDKMLVLEPAKRISPKEALNHPFIRGV